MILVVSMNLPKERATGQSPTEPKCRFEDLTGSPVLVQHFTQVTLDLVKAAGVRCIFIMGSAARWPDIDADDLDGLYRTVMEADIPIHGACFGHQLLGAFFNGDYPWSGDIPTLKRMRKLRPREPDTNPSGNYPGWFFERGVQPVEILIDDPVFEGIPNPAMLSEAHYWEVTKLPPGFVHLARTDECEIQAMRHRERPVYGTQFHPEVWYDIYQHGKRFMTNFFRLAGVMD
jgi:GMP synthase-like glutamine amidotransferase